MPSLHQPYCKFAGAYNSVVPQQFLGIYLFIFSFIHSFIVGVLSTEIIWQSKVPYPTVMFLS